MPKSTFQVVKTKIFTFFNGRTNAVIIWATGYPDRYLCSPVFRSFSGPFLTGRYGKEKAVSTSEKAGVFSVWRM